MEYLFTFYVSSPCGKTKKTCFASSVSSVETEIRELANADSERALCIYKG